MVCGVTTNVCVETTARDAGQRDFRTFIVRDATGEIAPERKEWALATLDTRFGTGCRSRRECFRSGRGQPNMTPDSLRPAGTAESPPETYVAHTIAMGVRSSAERTPAKIALAEGTRQLSYRALVENMDRVANAAEGPQSVAGRPCCADLSQLSRVHRNRPRPFIDRSRGGSGQSTADGTGNRIYLRGQSGAHDFRA